MTKTRELVHEKEMLVKAVRASEDQRRKTGRTTRIVAQAIEQVLATRDPVVLCGFSRDDTQRMVEMAHAKIDQCLHGDNSTKIKALVRGVSMQDGCEAIENERWFKDHVVLLERAVKAIEGL